MGHPQLSGADEIERFSRARAPSYTSLGIAQVPRFAQDDNL